MIRAKKKYLYALVIIIMALVAGWFTLRIMQLNKAEYVCGKAASIGDAYDIQLCGQLQEKYHLEYICKVNTIGEGRCWLEQK